MEDSNNTQKNYTRYLITGGLGFIALNLTDRLKSQGKEVFNFDTKNGYDVRNEKQLKEVIKDFKPDIIMSLASTAGIDRVEKDPIGCIDTNIVGVSNVIKHKGKAKLVHFSTSEVYGERADRNIEEDSTSIGSAGNPRWSYAASKTCADHLIINSVKNSLIIRPFNVYGPKQIGHGAIADFINWAIKGHDIKIYGDGQQLRSWGKVDGFLDGVMALIDNDCSGIYNVGDPRFPITIKELAEEIISVSNSSSKVYFVPKRDVDVYYRVPNIDKLCRDTNYVPTGDFHKDLKDTIKWYQDNPNCRW